MTDLDRRAFDAALGRLLVAFGKKLTTKEQEQLSATYFRMLADHPIDHVLNAAKTLLATSRKFPLVADWLAVLGGGATHAPADVRQMTATEVAERARAERLRYHDEPCRCHACVGAGVAGRELRFVPTLFGEEEARAFHPTHARVEVAGHFAHGEELDRWYVARDGFFAAARRFPKLRRRFAGLVERDSGEEG